MFVSFFAKSCNLRQGKWREAGRAECRAAERAAGWNTGGEAIPPESVRHGPWVLRTLGVGEGAEAETVVKRQ